MRNPVVAALIILLSSSVPATSFDVSSSYAAASELVPGRYACVSGLDFHDFTWTFNLAPDGLYSVEGLDGEGRMTASPDGQVAIDGGPFASDDTTAMYAMVTKRISDGDDVVILRYDFGDVVTDDYCARLD